MPKRGWILTVEPGIYIREGSPATRNTGISACASEDDVLITADGNRVLSAGAPKTVKEIEASWKNKGLGNMKLGTK